MINYEDIEKKLNENPREKYFSQLHYAFMFRRFNEVEKILKNRTLEAQKELLQAEGITGYEWITPIHCARWNWDYIKQFELSNKWKKDFQEISTIIEEIIKDNYEFEKIKPLLTYDEFIKGEKTAFEIFFGYEQPLINVQYIERQALPSKQLKNNKMSLVLDEVGTGKSVSALYAIADCIEDSMQKNRKAHILIIAPTILRTKWQNDIRRQLGRHAHIVSRGNSEEQYINEYKNVYFRNNEHCLFVLGNTVLDIKESLNKWKDNDFWDLVVIDECHLCFDSYKDIKANRVMLLTATPIVINVGSGRTFKDYNILMNNIVNNRDKYYNMYVSLSKDINPIINTNPRDGDVFVNNFREDMEISSTERTIRFIECKRSKDWEKWYSILYKENPMSALIHCQDDWYLFDEYQRVAGESEVMRPEKNLKIEQLNEIFKNRKSYIVFCEHIQVADYIYDEIKEVENRVAGKKYGIHEYIDEGKVENGALLDQLKQNIREGKQVILIVTGKTGGTGLNLGSFDGVIHYELPFTSIELEQRYGRVDRMDDLGDKKKEMIFLVNKVEEKEDGSNSYFDANRMLYYSVSKITATCEYMPVRNTVLYHPDFIKHLFPKFIKEFEDFKDSKIISEESEINIKAYKKEIISIESDFKEFIPEEYYENKENIREFINKIAKGSSVTSEIIEKAKKYLKLTGKIEEFEHEKNKFLERKNIAENLLKIFGILKVEETDEIFINFKIEKDEENQNEELNIDKDVLDYNIKQNTAKNKVENITIENQIEKLILKLNNTANISLTNELANGIFYIKDNKFQRRTVEEFRNNIIKEGE